MAIHLADHLVGAGPIHMDGGEPLWPFEPPPEPAAPPPAPPPTLPSVSHEPGVLHEAPANWLQQLPPPAAWHADIAYVAPEWGGPIGHSPLLDLPAPELGAPPLAPVAQPAPAPESALAPVLATVPAASPASATEAPAATVPASSAAAEAPVGADWLVQREAALQALRADFSAAHQEALALDRDILQSPDAPAFSEARFAEAFLAQAVATGNGAWQTLAGLYDTDPATLVARHSALLDLALNDHALNAGPPPPGRAMGSVDQLGMTDLVLADPLMHEVAQTFGRTPDAPRTALAWEQVRLYGQTRYEQMTRLHTGMESVRDQYSAALDRASQTADGPGWVDVSVQREVTTHSVQGDSDIFERHTVTTTERRFDPDAFTRWYNAQDGLANRAFAQLYGNSHTEYQAPLQHAGEAMSPAGPPTVSRIRFDNAPWHIDGLGAPMRREGLVGLDLNTAPRMNNDAAVGFDFEVGWATAPENIYDRPSTTRQLVQLAAVVATSYFTYGAVSGWAGGLGLGATSAAAVAGGAAAAAGSFTSGVMNGNLALKDIVRSAFSGALTAGLMQGLAATQVVRNAGDIGQMAMRMTVQGGVQALMGGEFRDGAAAAFASGLAQAVGQQLNDSFARSLPASDAAAARMVTRLVTSAIRALGNPGDPLSAFAGSLLNEVLQDSGLAMGGAAVQAANSTSAGVNANPALRAQALAEELVDLGYEPNDAAVEAMRRVGVAVNASTGSPGVGLAPSVEHGDAAAGTGIRVEIVGGLLPRDAYGNQYQVAADGRVLVTMATGGVIGMQPRPLVISGGVVQLTASLVREFAALARNPVMVVGSLLTAPANSGSSEQTVDVGNGVGFRYRTGETWGQKLQQNETGQWEVVADRAIGMPTATGFHVLTERELALLQAPKTQPPAPPLPQIPPLPAWADRAEVLPPYQTAPPAPTTPGFEPRLLSPDDLITFKTDAERLADANAAWQTKPHLRPPAQLLGQTDGGPGQWMLSGERRAGADYQEQVTGVPRGIEYELAGVKFDGYDAARGKLVDAKDWEGYVLPDRQFWVNEVRDTASRQLDALGLIGGSVRIEWRVSTEDAAAEIREVLRQMPRADRIDVVVEPRRP